MGKKFIALLLLYKHNYKQSMVATISGISKVGGGAKTVPVFSSLLFTQLDYAELVIFVLGSLLIM